MRTISLKHDLNICGQLEKGYVTLYGFTGKRYSSQALNVPGYGWVPCSRKLLKNFTTDSQNLVLVISDTNDANKPVTSDTWITVSNFKYIKFT